MKDIIFDNEKVFFKWDISESEWLASGQLEKIRKGEKSHYKVNGFSVSKQRVKEINCEGDDCVFEIGTFDFEKKELNFTFETFTDRIFPIEKDKIQEIVINCFKKIYYKSLTHIGEYYRKYNSKKSESNPFHKFDINRFNFFYKIIKDHNFGWIARNKMLETEMRSNFDENEFYQKQYDSIIEKYNKNISNENSYIIARKNLIKVILKQLENALVTNKKENNMQQIMKTAIPNIWPNYVKIKEKQKIDSTMNGVKYKNEADFICLDINDNIHVIEIKNGEEVKLIEESEYRNGIYSLSNNVHRPAAQLSHYINQLKNANDRTIKNIFGLNIKDLNTLSIKGTLIMGRSKNFTNEKQKNSWRIGIEQYKDITHIYTYDDIILILNSIINIK